METTSIAANLNTMGKDLQVYGVNVGKRLGGEEFEIGTIHARILELAKNYTHEEEDFEILTELQHYGVS